MTFIAPETITQILDRCEIVQIISAYIPLRPAGPNFKAVCPFHNEKTPSFFVSPEKQIFHCFGCHVGGNVIRFVMLQERLDFVEAATLLAEKVGVSIVSSHAKDSHIPHLRQQLMKLNELAVQYFHQNLLSDRSSATQTAREYLKNRGVGLEIVKKFRLGFALDKWDGALNHLKKQGVDYDTMAKAGLIIPQNQGDGYYDRFRNRIMFPIFDVSNRCIAFGGRTLQKDNDAKYVNSPETMIYTKGNHLYGLSLAKDAIIGQDFVVVVEGYMDFIMTFQSGIENVVASLGTALTVEQIRLLRRYTTNVVMLFDNDDAGEAAMVRSLDLLVEEGMNVKMATLSEGDDPDSFIRKMGVEKFREQINRSELLFNFKLAILRQQHDDKTIEGSTKISMAMLQTIGKFNNTVTRTEYVKRLARSLMVSEEALFIELKKISQNNFQHQHRPKEESTGEVKQSPEISYELRPVERNLLRLMLEEREFLLLSKEDLTVTDFQTPCARYMVEKIYNFFEEKNDANLAALIGSFEDQRVVEMISSFAIHDGLLGGDRKKIYFDCVSRLKEDRLRAQRQTIRHQMIAAKDSGDLQRLQELAEEFNQLIKTKN